MILSTMNVAYIENMVFRVGSIGTCISWLGDCAEGWLRWEYVSSTNGSTVIDVAEIGLSAGVSFGTGAILGTGVVFGAGVINLLPIASFTMVEGSV